MELLPYALAIIVLLVLSGFLSGTETAMTGVERAPILRRAKEDGRAKVLLRLIDKKERLIGTLLINNNIVNILAASLATDVLIRLTGEAGVVYATLGMTILVVIFGEVLPKTYAIRNPEGMSLFMARPMAVVVFLFRPLTALLHVIIDGILRLFGTSSASGTFVRATEQLRGSIAQFTAEGNLARLEGEMLGGVLDLEEVEVGQIMTHRKEMAMLDADWPLTRAIETALAAPHSRFPVYKHNPEEIVGVANVRDLLALARTAGEEGMMGIETALNPPWFIPDGTSLRHQLLAFRQRREHLAIVVDEYGAIQGLVTLEDVLEEIVGEIADEKDVEVSGIKSQEDGSVLVEGRVPVRDLNRQFGWELPEDDAATVAGLVIEAVRRLPEAGETVRLPKGLAAEVLRRRGNALTLLRLSAAASNRSDP